MTKAPSAPAKGIDYQSCWFWLYAARMLREPSDISRVYYEEGAKGLDDVGVLTEPPHRHGVAGYRDIERFQIKFHVGFNALVKGADLADREFIGSTVASFIERARDAVQADRDRGLRSLAVFVTDWAPDPDDALREILDAGTGLLDVDRLMDAKAGKFRTLRDIWQSTTALDNGAFRELVGSLRLELAGGSFWRLEAELNDAFVAARLKPMNLSLRSRVYHDIARRFIEEGDNEFEADRLRQILSEEKQLLDVSPKASAPPIGVRTILRFAEDLPSKTDALLDLVEHFDRRRIRDETLWDNPIYPAIDGWVAERVADRDDRGYELHLACSTSVAVATGFAFDPKSGIRLSLAQATRAGRELWSVGTAGNQLALAVSTTEGAGDEAAVIVSASREIGPAATEYIRATLGAAGPITTVRGDPPRGDLLADGADAQQLANISLAAISTLRDAGAKRVHLFSAAPNASMFMIGRGLRGLGPVTVYDYDLDDEHDGSYAPGITLPAPRPTAAGA